MDSVKCCAGGPGCKMAKSVEEKQVDTPEIVKCCAGGPGCKLAKKCRS